MGWRSTSKCLCKLGSGGTWGSGLKGLQPFLWQLKWPSGIQNDLIMDENPEGSLTINDLELAGIVLNWLALECHIEVPLAYHHVGVFCDNTSAVAWTRKIQDLQIKSSRPPAMAPRPMDAYKTNIQPNANPHHWRKQHNG